MKANDLYAVCRVLNTWRWDLVDEDSLPSLSSKASTLAKIEAHVFEPEDIEDIIEDIDAVDFEWCSDHTDNSLEEDTAEYIATEVGRRITKSNLEFIITRR
jgi:hypothetical protein